MYGRERRQAALRDAVALRAGLMPSQLKALDTLEQFGWSLRFVRRPMFLDPIPVVFDRHGTRYAVLEADGTLNETPGFKLRD